MTVKTFEEKYHALQKEGNEIYAAIKPLLVRLNGFAHRCKTLYAMADRDKRLYLKTDDCRRDGDWEPNGWNYNLLFRLSDMEWVYDSAKGIDNALFNLKHTPFRKAKKRRKHAGS